MDISLSLAKLSDAEVLKEISVQAFVGNNEKYGHFPPGIESLTWHQTSIRQSSYYKILYDDNIVGGIYLIGDSGNVMKIEYLFVSPDFHGKKIGTGAVRLLEEKFSNVKKWFLFTPYRDYRNHHFYTKLGYEKVGEFIPEGKNSVRLFQFEKVRLT